MNLQRPAGAVGADPARRLLPAGAVDCDLHPAPASLDALLPYLDDHWRESASQRGLHELQSIAYPPNAPISARPDWRPETGPAGGTLNRLCADALAPFGTAIGICNCLYGVGLLHSEDMAAAFARAVNQWVAAEWLDQEPRLRAAIALPIQSPELSVREIEHWAGDRRFVQVLLPVMDEAPLGKRRYWPIYEAACRHGLAVGIHAGGTYRHPVTGVGWPSYHIEDYAAQAQAFQSQLTSLICEGVFARFPELRVVLIESGFTWLPAHLWRLTKFWRGLRAEIPWVDRPPAEIARDHIRLTLQPVDAPSGPEAVERLMEHLGSDRLLLFSSDYPHWHYDGADALPEGLSPALLQRIAVENPRETYPRLMEGAA